MAYLRIDGYTKRREDNTHKQYPSDTQREILDTQMFPCPQTQADNQCKQYDRLRNRRR